MRTTSHLLATLLLSLILACATTSPRFVEKPVTAGTNERLVQNEAIKKKYHFTYEGYDFVGFPNVFSPLIFPSTAMFDALPIHPGQSFLEIGSGTGALAVTAALKGARHVVAVDINPDAVANTVENTILHHVQNKVQGRVSDIFSDIERKEKFDIIFWNIPFCHTERKNLSLLEQAAFDPEHKLLERYLAEGARHLRPDGHLYVGYSSTHGDVDYFHGLASKYSWDTKLIHKSGTEDTLTLELYELTPKKEQE